MQNKRTSERKHSMRPPGMSGRSAGPTRDCLSCFPAMICRSCSAHANSVQRRCALAPWQHPCIPYVICFTLCLSFCSVAALATSSSVVLTSQSSTDPRCPVTANRLAQFNHLQEMGIALSSWPRPSIKFRLRGGGGKKGKKDSDEDSEIEEE